MQIMVRNRKVGLYHTYLPLYFRTILSKQHKTKHTYMFISSDEQLTITYKDHGQPEADIGLHYFKLLFSQEQVYHQGFSSNDLLLRTF